MEALSLLGIDFWSVFLYIVNFGLIFFVIWKFFSNPIIETLENRRDQIQNNISEAEKLRNELAHQKHLMEKEKDELKTSMQTEMDNLKTDLEKKRKEAENDIDMRRAKMLEEVKKTIDEQKEAIKGELKEDIVGIVTRMVLYIVSNKVPEDVISASARQAWDNYKK